MNYPRGSMLLEALIAVGVASMYITGILGLVLTANRSSDRAEETERAVWNMNEGLEALQTVTFADLPTTNTGSLTFGSGSWAVGALGPQILSDGMIRTVKIQSVNRDAQCLVVASGGTLDPDSKTLVSEVSWTDTAGRLHTISSSSLRTNWENPTGSCFAATMVNQITFDISGAVYSGGKQLRQVYFTNNGTTAATIDKIAMTWNNGAEFDQLFMDNSKVWSASGPGTPAGSQLSGTELDIQNFVLAPGATAELNKGQFNINMGGTTLTMTVTFTDGSSWTSPVFYPL
ncbi:MAG: hypothetical protein AAB448_01530 [Patescibacteria group bacterium]